MNKSISEIKKEFDDKLAKSRLKRKGIVSVFKKKAEKKKIEQIRNSILYK